MPEEEQAQQEETKTQEEPTGQAEQAKNGSQNTPAPEKKSGGILQWIILAAAILVFAAVGFVLGRLMGKGPAPAEAQTTAQQESEQQDNSMNLLLDKAAGTKGWYYDLEAVATNLSEPGSTRYVRAALTLEMLPKVDKAKATTFLDERKPIMINLLNIYFAGLTVEDLNSNKDMRRIQAELLDIFNENLFPGGKPLIKSILFREFGVQ